MPSIFLKDKQNWAPIFRGSAAITNILLNILLIPKYGILGATIATLVSYFTMSSYLYLKNREWMIIPINYKLIIPYFLLSIFLFIITLYAAISMQLVISFLYSILSIWILSTVISISEIKQKLFLK